MAHEDNRGFSQSPLFRDLPGADLDELARHAVTKRYRKNTVVISKGDQGDSLYLIRTGRVRVYLDNEDGDELTLLTLGPGESFGELALLSDQPRVANVITLEDCELSQLSKAAFLDCVHSRPDICVRLIGILVSKLQTLTDDMNNIALLDVYGRIAKTLTKHASPEMGELITEKMTHQDLANLVGASREMVSRILKDLREGEYIEIREKRIIIKRELPSAW